MNRLETKAKVFFPDNLVGSIARETKQTTSLLSLSFEKLKRLEIRGNGLPTSSFKRLKRVETMGKVFLLVS